MPSQPKNKKKTVRRKAPVKKRTSTVKPKKKVLSPWWILGALAAILCLAVGIPHFLEKGNPITGAAVPEGYRHFVLDLSHHNPREIQWDSLKVVIDKDGNTSKNLQGAAAILPVHHVILKATEGESMVDPHFRDWWEEAGQAGLSRGAYHFFRSSRNAQLQAQNFIESVQLTHRDLPPVLDLETVHDGCTRQQLNLQALTWLRMVEEHYGRTPVVYTSDSFAKDWLDKEIRDNYPLWIARYSQKKEKPQTSGWRFWQFTDKAVVYGVKGNVDLSVF